MRYKCKDNDNLTNYRKITVKNMSKWQNRHRQPPPSRSKDNPDCAKNEDHNLAQSCYF